MFLEFLSLLKSHRVWILWHTDLRSVSKLGAPVSLMTSNNIEVTGPVHNKNWLSTSDRMSLTYQTFWRFKNEAEHSYLPIDLIFGRAYALL